MTAVWTSRHKGLVSDGIVFPHECNHRVVPARGVVGDRGNPVGSAVDAGRDTTACARRDGLSVLRREVCCPCSMPSRCRHGYR